MNWMGWIMKGPVCHAKKLGVYPQSHKELLKGVLSRGSDLCVRRIALAGLWRVDGRGQSWRQGDQSGFLGIFSVVLQILQGGLGWAWHPHAQKDNKSSGGLSEMASRLSLIPPSFAQPSTPTQFQPKGHYSQVPALPRVARIWRLSVFHQKGSCWSGPLWIFTPGMPEPKHCLSSHTQPAVPSTQSSH